MLTLAQIATIGSRRNAPNLRKLRGLIDHATKTPPARVALGSALRERGSQRDTDPVRCLSVRVVWRLRQKVCQRHVTLWIP